MRDGYDFIVEFVAESSGDPGGMTEGSGGSDGSQCQ